MINNNDFKSIDDTKHFVLKNGVNVILDPNPNYQSASIGFFLKKGSN